MKDEKVKINVVSIKLIKEDDFYCKLTRSLDAAQLIREFIGEKDREHAIVICLNTRNEINNISTISIGSLSYSIVHPREVFKTAILSNSASIILGHNHPNGLINPGKEDKEITFRIKNGGEILGVTLLDHIIVGFNNLKYFSFKENGIL